MRVSALVVVVTLAGCTLQEAPRRDTATIAQTGGIRGGWNPDAWRVPAGVVQKVPASQRLPPVSTVPDNTCTNSSAG